MSDYPIAGTPGNLFAQVVTIASGASASERIGTYGKALVGILMPAAWTAADIGYKTCLTGNDADLVTVYDAGGNASTTVVAASTHIAFPTSDAIFVPFLQIQSVAAGGGSTTPVPQGAARSLILLFRNLFD